ncbi:hypothetical protein P3S67_011420 [Capsicum chacoense]
MAFRLGNELAYGARRALLGAPQQFSRRYSQQLEHVLSIEKEEVGSKGRGLPFFSGLFAGSFVYMFWGFRQQAKIDKFRADLQLDMWAEKYQQIQKLGKRKQK